MPKFPCTLKRDTLHGWNTVRLANGLIEVVIVPDIGGRIIQLRLGGHELLYFNPRHLGRVYSPDENCAAAGWKNYGGSKVWPAPQGWEGADQWPGPPDPVLDGGPYSLSILSEGPESVAVHLTSQPDERTGLTFSRQIRLQANSATLQIAHQMLNTSSRTVRWGIWQVTHQDARRPLSVYVPATRFRQMFGDQPFDRVHLNREKRLWRLDYTDQVAKFAVEAEQGWLVAMRPEDRFALVETFPLFRERAYPDGAPVECWVNGKGTFTVPTGQLDAEADPNGCDPYIETEILSPLVELEPGESYAFPLCWHATQAGCPKVADVTEAALISEPLRATPEQGQIRVTGSCGFFHVGTLELSADAAEGQSLAIHRLGEVSPSVAFPLDCSITVPAGARKLKLCLKTPKGACIEVAELQIEDTILQSLTKR